MAREKLKMRRHDTRNVLKWRAIKTPNPMRSPGNPRVLPGESPLPRGDGRRNVRSPRPRGGFLLFLLLLFNILKCDERINKACLPDPYVPFSAARA